MIHGLEKLNLKWQAEGRKEISIGIGLNTGPVNVGNMGSAKRLAWTVMGDNVNLASRLEGMTKQYRSHMVIHAPIFLVAKPGQKRGAPGRSYNCRSPNFRSKANPNPFR